MVTSPRPFGSLVESKTVDVRTFPKVPLRITGRAFRDCVFDNCGLGMPPTVEARSYIGRCSLAGCKQRACMIAGAVLDDIRVDGLSRLGNVPLFLAGVAFRHVELRGAIGLFKVTSAPQVVPTPADEATWIAANERFYSTVDWALDISGAQFTFGPDLQYVPGHLIRRDAETQVLVRRRVVENVAWRDLPWGRSALGLALQWFLEKGPYDSAVLVAGRKTTSFRRDMTALEMLRKEGLAE
jgi:hypothetical protein